MAVQHSSVFQLMKIRTSCLSQHLSQISSFYISSRREGQILLVETENIQDKIEIWGEDEIQVEIHAQGQLLDSSTRDFFLLVRMSHQEKKLYYSY